MIMAGLITVNTISTLTWRNRFQRRVVEPLRDSKNQTLGRLITIFQVKQSLSPLRWPSWLTSCGKNRCALEEGTNKKGGKKILGQLTLWAPRTARHIPSRGEDKFLDIFCNTVFLKVRFIILDIRNPLC
jgi:hypothetical protein